MNERGGTERREEEEQGKGESEGKIDERREPEGYKCFGVCDRSESVFYF